MPRISVEICKPQWSPQMRYSAYRAQSVTLSSRLRWSQAACLFGVDFKSMMVIISQLCLYLWWCCLQQDFYKSLNRSRSAFVVSQKRNQEPLELSRGLQVSALASALALSPASSKCSSSKNAGLSPAAKLASCSNGKPLTDDKSGEFLIQKANTLLSTRHATYFMTSVYEQFSKIYRNHAKYLALLWSLAREGHAFVIKHIDARLRYMKRH